MKFDLQTLLVIKLTQYKTNQGPVLCPVLKSLKKPKNQGSCSGKIMGCIKFQMKFNTSRSFIQYYS